MKPIMPRKFKGNYIHYGIREHMMGAVMNGIALHKGFLPYGGTFLVFSDYMRASMRLSSIMKAKVVYVLTHDSIGLGEDGPTHQPIEHLAMLRATPNLNVFRPADAVETAEAWRLALSHNGPSVLALSRQGLPAIRDEKKFENLTEKGGYIIKDVKGNRDVTIIASGSEVNIALQVSDLLSKHKVNAAVISMPCWELFENQNNDYKSNVIGNVLKVAIEAGSELGWHKYIW
jgi:Transketolase